MILRAQYLMYNLGLKLNKKDNNYINLIMFLAENLKKLVICFLLYFLFEFFIYS